MERRMIAALLCAVLSALALKLLFPAAKDTAARLAACAAGIENPGARIETMGEGLAEYGLTDTIVCAFDAVRSGGAYPVGRMEKGK